MKKKKTAPGGASKNTPKPPDGCNCYEFDGKRFLPGIPVSKLRGTRRLGVSLIREDAPGGIPLAANPSRRPKVTRGRVYVAGFDPENRELTNGREGGRHLIVLTIECESICALHCSSADDHLISVSGPFEDDAWNFGPGRGTNFGNRAFKLLLRLPYEGQSDRSDIEASITPAVRLCIFDGAPMKAVVIGVDPAYIRGADACRPWVAPAKWHAEVTRKLAKKLSRKLFAATEKIKREGLRKRERPKFKITRRRRVRESVLA